MDHNLRNLRSACIKLAYEKPELRAHLLPLLKQAAIRSLVKFELPRRVVMTRGVSETAKRNRKFSSEVRKALFDYQHGKWGKTQRDSVKRNNAVLNDGAEDQVFAVYETDEGDIYIITEWDKSATTILFPNEY